ncbi:hypothetical protein HYN48_02840 [Flavobacterium magnum]|uniref:Uncharacterized protein n=1 Tax=Flavobacterium magnum TaxID=2162713 RepID=A0A2S0RAP2_9FLAO|nr:hypothetical protein [Flavobacterium magnum]AWA29107.1 hypothetical protein HYN48_02840 [Flavobacterium magnum]
MRKITLSMLIISVLTSCGKMATKFMVNNYNGTFMVWHYTNGIKDVQFIPMSHINKSEKFDRIKQITDSLRENGYVVYYENVKLKNSEDFAHNDTVSRKFRKIVGIVPGDYSDKTQDAYKNLALKGYVMQTATNTGIDSKRDIQADLSVDTLVSMYEKQRGRIVLEGCDWSTSFSDRYNCHKLNISDQQFMVVTLRNRHLANFVTRSKHKKIAIMYGAEHQKNFENDLKKFDANWHFVHNNPLIRW